MNSISVTFAHPWLLFLIIPMILLALRPYLSLPRKMRFMKKRVISLVIHLVIMIILVFVIAGFNVENQYLAMKSDVIILVDDSMSNSINKNKIDDIVQSILDESPDDYQIGIMTFGKDQLYTASLNTDKEIVYDQFYLSEDIDQSQTVIDQALLAASEKLKDPKKGRVILISDGRQTDGNAIVTAKEIADQGTRIDTFYVAPDVVDNDAQLSAIVLETSVDLGIETTVNILVDSTLDTEGTLTIEYTNELDDVISETQDVQITKGSNEFAFTHAFVDLGLTTIYASLSTSETDVILENNSHYGFVHIENNDLNKLLIIESQSGESEAISSYLSEVGYEIDTLTIDHLPSSISELVQYSEVILMNVKNADLTPSGFSAILDTYVKSYGGGLLTIGGNRAYQKEDMIGDSVDQTFSDLLPVESSTDPKAMVVVIVMDASGSMSANDSTKLELAKAGAIASLEALASQNGETSHQFGLVTFDANLKDVIEITSVDNKDAVISQINNIESGHGTYYTQGLQKAKDMLSEDIYDNAQKHIIFLTDGGPQDDESQYLSVLNSLNDISVSTIALGVEGENDLNPDLVESMVREFNGRGSFYRVENQNQLYSVMLSDTEQAQSGDFVNEVPFVGIINSIIPSLAGISSMPEIGGYYGTRAKTGANIVVETVDGDPLFALWIPEDSLGRVASFTSDLDGSDEGFSSEFVNDFVGKAFIRGMVESVLPTRDVSTSDMNVSFIDENSMTSVRIRSNIGEGEIIQAQLINPLGETTRVSLTSISKTTLSGIFDTKIPGVYELEVTKYDSQGNAVSFMTSYTTYTYSNEYVHEYNEEETISLMEEIAHNGNGTYLYQTNNMFSREAETATRDIDMTVIIMVIAMTLFLGDIVIRKFNFKWSQKYFSKQYKDEMAYHIH